MADTLIIPHNTTMTDPHWKFRTLIDGTQVKDVSEVVDLIRKDRTRRGLISRAVDPTGPPMRRWNGFVDPNQRTRISNHDEYLNNITDLVPQDAEQRTPLRYTTYAPITKTTRLTPPQRSGDEGRATTTSTDPTSNVDASATPSDRASTSSTTPPSQRPTQTQPETVTSVSRSGSPAQPPPINRVGDAADTPLKSNLSPRINISGLSGISPDSDTSNQQGNDSNQDNDTTTTSQNPTSSADQDQGSRPNPSPSANQQSDTATSDPFPTNRTRPTPLSDLGHSSNSGDWHTPSVAQSTWHTSVPTYNFAGTAIKLMNQAQGLFRGIPVNLGANNQGGGGGGGSNNTNNQGGGGGGGPNNTTSTTGASSNSSRNTSRPGDGGGSGGDGGGGGGDGGGGRGPSGDPRSSNPYHKPFTMKPDLNYFPKLTDEAQVASWHFKFKAAAYGTNLGDVLDSTYVVPPEEVVSYSNKCRWLYHILLNTVLTTEGRNILYRHRETKDGRQVLHDLLVHASGSF